LVTGGIKKVSFYLFVFIFLLPLTTCQENYVDKVSVENKENLIFVYEIVRYPAKIDVMNLDKSNLKLGVSVDPTIIDFGRIYEGMSGKRYINIFNNKDFIYKATLSSRGNISSMIEFEKNNFLIKERETLNISVTAKPINPGSYTGEIDVVLKRMKYPIFNWLLKWL